MKAQLECDSDPKAPPAKRASRAGRASTKKKHAAEEDAGKVIPIAPPEKTVPEQTPPALPPVPKVQSSAREIMEDALSRIAEKFSDEAANGSVQHAKIWLQLAEVVKAGPERQDDSLSRLLLEKLSTDGTGEETSEAESESL